MWQQYKKTMIPTQLFIVTICIVMLVMGKVAWQAVATLFVLLQLFALVGAAWGKRIKRKIEDSRGGLPLEHR